VTFRGLARDTRRDHHYEGLLDNAIERASLPTGVHTR
jgi:hypothetical protein